MVCIFFWSLYFLDIIYLYIQPPDPNLLSLFFEAGVPPEHRRSLKFDGRGGLCRLDDMFGRVVASAWSLKTGYTKWDNTLY